MHRIAETSINTVAILRALQLGDLLCAVPAWRALRKALPSARITLIGLPWARGFVHRFGAYLDDFIEFPGYPGLAERAPQIQDIPNFESDVQRRRFDLVLQMHGDGSITNTIVGRLRGKVTAGFFPGGSLCSDPTFFCPYPDDQQEIRRHLRLMQHLGIPLDGEQLEFPLSSVDYRALEALQEAAALQPQQFVCVHVGGRAPERRWPAAHFGRVAQAIANMGFTIVLTGTAQESPLAETVAGVVSAGLINLVGRTDLGTLGALVSRARILVANDTGVSHLAAALGVPSLIICTGSDPNRWGPLDRWRHRVVMGDSITIDQVIHKTKTLLGDTERLAA